MTWSASALLLLLLVSAAPVHGAAPLALRALGGALARTRFVRLTRGTPPAPAYCGVARSDTPLPPAAPLLCRAARALAGSAVDAAVRADAAQFERAGGRLPRFFAAGAAPDVALRVTRDRVRVAGCAPAALDARCAAEFGAGFAAFRANACVAARFVAQPLC